MVHFNQFSVVEKSHAEKRAELATLGFDVLSDLSAAKLLARWLTKAPVTSDSLQATADMSFDAFVAADRTLTCEAFYCVGLQLLEFVVNFEFQADKAVEFAQKTGLVVLPADSISDLIDAFYQLLCTRTKGGMLLVEKWVSEGLLPVDNAFHFFNDKSLATFDTSLSALTKEVVYVETPVDTFGRGTYDLVKVQILRPNFSGKLPVVMTASPYHLGINELANDKRLHEMKTDLTPKTLGQLSVEERLPKDPGYEKIAVPLADKATETFTHGWSSSLNDYLLARGFASVYVAGVGTRGSDGMQTSGDYQQIYSMKAVIDWLGGRARAFVDKKRSAEIRANWASGNVAMTGKSYLGTMAYGIATTGVDGLKVILAESGISSWYTYYREGGLVRSPGGFPGEDLDVLAELTYSRNLEGADYLAANAAYQKALDALSEAQDRLTGDYNQFWHARNYLPYAKNVRCDVLIEHGLQDWNVTPDQAYNYWQALPETLTKHAILHRGAHIYCNAWQSFDYSELINTYFTAKLLDRPLALALPPVILQENGKSQSWTTAQEWGAANTRILPLGTENATFENAYDDATFERYAKDFNGFKKDLFENRANAVSLELPILSAFAINGSVKLQLRLKLTDTKGFLSAQLLDAGPKKRLADAARPLALGALDRGRNFQFENLVELPLTDTPYQVITKGFVNLENRESLSKLTPFSADEWLDVTLALQPTLYQLTADSALKLVLYTTDFEHTIRDNRAATYTIDLAASKLVLPY
ncbi:MAG: Xaa-Pro dipeptidyl-peptidase [Streptococcaceae bacterium]|jgi:X-Pro dipeptidyl-peptidase|nr:Xaa-Pro dipeptidyl-peptidase [Streptococcaceae bacterium]